MSEVVGPDQAGIEAAIRALDAGEAIVLPTDTVYGLGSRPEHAARLFEIKGRPRDLTLPVLVATVEDAREVAVLDERAETLAASFWPGALTMVLGRATRSAGWDLGIHVATVGVRVPAERVARTLLEPTGPLAVTSANHSGEPTPDTCEGVRGMLGDDVAVYLCTGTAPGGTPSTVVDLSGEPRVIRAGAIPIDDLLAALEAG
jgi:tRNA threonylcarbamoyl adenosine modification protein (Sua5/YciO/YrdC/YwlC family)